MNPEQDQIFKLGSLLIEKDMQIEKQAFEIEKLSKKVARIKPAKETATKPAGAKKTEKPKVTTKTKKSSKLK